MPSWKCLAAALLAVCSALPALAQEDSWTYRVRTELRANYRNSPEARFELQFPFPPIALPPGQTKGFMETPDAGGNVELSVAAFQLDLGYGEWFGARARIHLEDKYRRNPTSTDRKIDADELFVRLGQMPELLERPDGTTFFLLAGKAPRMERQPVRLLESYGLAATSFNRFEDVQLMGGGTVGRNFYWRLVVANGNPLFMRDANALAGDNGIPELREPFPNPAIKSGFPILYNAETEDLFFDTSNLQFGQGLGYRWRTEDQTLGFDALLFHYDRELADRAELTGTFYGGDLDLIDDVLDQNVGLPLTSRKKEEWGGRLYAEWYGLTGVAQFTKQNLAGLWREGWEGEVGWRLPLQRGCLQYVQPAVRYSQLDNRFRGRPTFPAPSLWWDWTKTDFGVRVGFTHGLDLTVEHSIHDIVSPRPLDVTETLVTLRWRWDA
ncbi:MAG TPA: hypothetical protein VF618_22080 [Thermoanaerobaculia bacterium]